jgi:hypothetical protein
VAVILEVPVRTIRRSLSRVAVVFVLLLALTGCGDDDGDGVASPETTVTGDGTPGTDPEPVDADGPEPGIEDDEPTDVGGENGLRGIAFTITSSSANLDLAFDVSLEEVEAAQNPAMVWIVCTGATSSNPGLLSGLYFVTGFDRFRESGLRHVGIESYDEVDGPGTYRGVVEINDSAGRFVSVPGELTINGDGRSGTLVGADDDGNDMTVTYRCEV